MHFGHKPVIWWGVVVLVSVLSLLPACLPNGVIRTGAGGERVASIGYTFSQLKRDVSLPGQPVVRVTLRRVPDSSLVFQENLTQFRQLRDLVMEGPYEDADFAALPAIPWLERLELRRTRITEQGLRYLAKFPNLGALAVCGGQFIGPLGAKHIKGLGKLRALDFTGTDVLPSAILELHELQTLEEFVSECDQIRDEHLAALGQLANLRVVRLGCWKITDDGLKHLAKMLKLRVLHVIERANPSLTDAGIIPLGALGELRDLRLVRTALTDAGLEALITGITKVDTLGVPSSRVGDQGIEYLARLPNLHVLDLSNTQVTGAGLLRLVALQNLQDLALRWLAISDVDLQVLQALRQLRRLDVSGTKITPAGLDSLQDALPRTEIISGE
jgi:hypothetical protein